MAVGQVNKLGHEIYNGGLDVQAASGEDLREVFFGVGPRNVVIQYLLTST
jgi:hypothetical protein